MRLAYLAATCRLATSERENQREAEVRVKESEVALVKVGDGLAILALHPPFSFLGRLSKLLARTRFVQLLAHSRLS